VDTEDNPAVKNEAEVYFAKVVEDFKLYCLGLSKLIIQGSCLLSKASITSY